MPTCKQAIVYTEASKTRANPKTENPVRFASVSTTPPKRGKTPEIANFIETRKSDLYIQIITHRQ